MMTTLKTEKCFVKLIVFSLLWLFFILDISQLAFARKEGGQARQGGGSHVGPRHANPPGARGGHGAGRDMGNPPGPAGGQGRGPAWRDNPNRIDNPPGLVGGRGTDWGNPPGPAGGQGRGPAWTDNPNRIDNPPGPVGGRGTDWGTANQSEDVAGSDTGYTNSESSGSVGGPGMGRGWRRHMFERRLERLRNAREKWAAKGESAEKLEKLDSKIAKMEAKRQQFMEKQTNRDRQ